MTKELRLVCPMCEKSFSILDESLEEHFIKISDAEYAYIVSANLTNPNFFCGKCGEKVERKQRFVVDNTPIRHGAVIGGDVSISGGGSFVGGDNIKVYNK